MTVSCNWLITDAVQNTLTGFSFFTQNTPNYRSNYNHSAKVICIFDNIGNHFCLEMDIRITWNCLTDVVGIFQWPGVASLKIQKIIMKILSRDLSVKSCNFHCISRKLEIVQMQLSTFLFEYGQSFVVKWVWPHNNILFHPTIFVFWLVYRSNTNL